MKFLVVDDSKTMRMIVKRTLRQAGFGDHDVIEAVNGKDGLEKVAADTPDLILCDWNMPEMNGMEFLQALKSDGKNIKFGFVTSEGTPEMVQSAMDNGALFLISKPFTADTFKEKLEPVL
jgi:two-component system chemotaxis response regulator CheY